MALQLKRVENASELELLEKIASEYNFHLGLEERKLNYKYFPTHYFVFASGSKEPAGEFDNLRKSCLQHFY